jgi:hypothetical protein
MPGPHDESDWRDAGTVEIASLILDDRLSPREALNEQWVVGYAALMADDVRFPPIKVMRIALRGLCPTDGRHRIAAAQRCGRETIEARIRDGTWDDAVEEAATANAGRGLPLSSSEKRRAVAMMLTQPKLAEMSDREIARRLGISPTTVGAVRAEHLSTLDTHEPIENIEGDFSPPPDRRVVHRGGQEYLYTVPRQRGPVQPIQEEPKVEPIRGRSEPSRPPKAPPSEEDAIIKQIMALGASLSYPAQMTVAREWRLTPRPVTSVDIGVWLRMALDSQRREVADKAFDFIVSNAEKLKHDEKVRAWLDEYERATPDHEPNDDAAPAGEP